LNKSTAEGLLFHLFKSGVIADCEMDVDDVITKILQRRGPSYPIIAGSGKLSSRP
jgi:hypothetical protein